MTDARTLRALANKWASEFAEAGMPYPMPLSMYPDAWLRAEADRIESAEAEKLASATEEFKQFCVRNNVDPETVILDTVETEHRRTFMWRTPVGFPTGGTYEAEAPRSHDDVMVAHRTTITVRFDAIGFDERAQATISHGDLPISSWLLVEESPWVGVGGSDR